MDKSKQDLYKEEARKSKEGNFRTSFYYVDSAKAESLGISEYKSKKGDNFIRIVTPDISKFWALEIFKHSNVGANRATFLCLEKMFNEPCPVCQKAKEFREADPADPRIKVLYPGRRFLVFLYDVTNESTEAEGLKWFDCPSQIKDNIMGLCENKREGSWVEIEDPINGRDIEFNRSGSGLNTKYTGFKLIETDPIPKSWTKNIPDFVDILLIPDIGIMEEEVSGIPKSSEDSEEDAENTRSTRRRYRSSEEEEEEEDEGEEEEDVETEIEEESTTRRRSKREETPVETKKSAKEVEEKPSITPTSEKLSAIQQKIADMKKKRETGSK